MTIKQRKRSLPGYRAIRCIRTGVYSMFIDTKQALETQNISTKIYNDLRSSKFQQFQEQIYKQFQQARTAERIGAFVNNEFLWGKQNSIASRIDNYCAPSRIHIPESFLRQSVVERLIRDIFQQWHFQEDSNQRMYEVKVTAARYHTTLTASAMPSHLQGLQGLVDNAIIVLRKSNNILGGSTRIFDLDINPIYELDLEVGQAVFVKGCQHLYQVMPIKMNPKMWLPGDEAIQDILTVRFQPMGC